MGSKARRINANRGQTYVDRVDLRFRAPRHLTIHPTLEGPCDLTTCVGGDGAWVSVGAVFGLWLDYLGGKLSNLLRSSNPNPKHHFTVYV